jgi:hypothetical protein
VTLAVVLAALAFATQAQAATYTVGTTADTAAGASCSSFPSGCSLRQLIEHENAVGTNDTIVVPAGSYSLIHGQLAITQSTTIAGAGARSTSVTQQTTSPTSRVFAVQASASSGIEPTVTISGLAISGGRADSTNGFFGGNVLNTGTLTLSEDSIENGMTTNGSGAGISNDGGTLTVTHSLVALNGSAQTNDSGGIQNVGNGSTPSTLTVIDSTIATNTSAQGGGIMSWSNARNTATVINSTITGNDGGTRNAGGGGLLAADGGTISVQNSIVSGNTVDTPSPGTLSNCVQSGSPAGKIKSLGNNLESGTDCGFTSAGDLQNTNPQFGSSSPQNNGGNTDTFALAFVSPAVDHIPAGAAGCGGTDQRDVVRPHGAACDIGAFEFVQPAEGGQFSGTLLAPDCGIETGPTVDWGDGTRSNEPSLNGVIDGSHVYAEEGTYTVTVRWSNDCNSNGTSQSFTVHVPDAPLTGAGGSFTAQTGTAFTGPVAALTDGDPGGVASDYSVTINWGDGSASAGTVTAAPGGFRVMGTHTYAAAGTFLTTVSIADAGGATTVARGTAIVNSVPSAVLTSAPTIGSTTAGFSGSVNPGGLATTALFEYALDPKYAGGGQLVYTQATPAQAVGSDFTSHSVSASVSGLVPNALYHVRLVATNSAGTTVGPDIPFTTLKSAPPGAPALGKTFNIAPVSGVVLIVLHGQLVPLTEVQQIPKNTVIDAQHGTLHLTTALPGGSGGARDAAAKGKQHRRRVKTQSGTFGGAIFKISQATSGANKGLATITLVEGAFQGAPSYATCKAHKAAEATAAASNTLQLLHASAHGKFRTSGRYSAATVRGTKWTIADRCDGTLTHDITDSVAVTDFVHHKTVVLHAGQSYLAKAPKRKH